MEVLVGGAVADGLSGWVSLPDATARHLEVRWGSPPSVVVAGLASARPYAGRADALAVWRDGADAAVRPGRRDRLIAAEAHAERISMVDLSNLCAVQSALLGEPAAFRRAEAYARHPIETRRYGWTPDLEARFAARLPPDDAHPIVRACRLYLDIIFVHPFEDGNGRAARLWLAWTLRRAGWGVPDLARVAAFPKEPGRPLRYWGFVAYVARLLTPVEHG